MIRQKLNKLYLFLFLVVLLLTLVIAQIIGGDITAIQGAENIPFPVFLNNNESIVGLQVEVSYPSYLTYKNLEQTSRMPNATIIINNETSGILKIAALIQDEIESGQGEIFNLIFDVNESAVPGNYDIDLSNFIAANQYINHNNFYRNK
jgi:hypothetical protein